MALDYALMDECLTHDRQNTLKYISNLRGECEGASQPELNFALMDEFATHNRPAHKPQDGIKIMMQYKKNIIVHRP